MASSEHSGTTTSVGFTGRTIVLAVDGSQHSERALRWYLQHFHRAEDSLFLYHSVEFPVVPILTTSEEFYQDQIREAIAFKHEEIKKLTAKFEEIIQSENISATFHARDGESPGQSIVHYAREKGADCVVIGSRGLGTLRRTFLGSVSDYVIHHAKMPVIVIPPLHS